MSRGEDREDLMAEATALVERGRLNVAGFSEPIVAGFRRGSEASIYFGGDRAYHFNAAGQLRRAIVDDLLYRAEEGRLVSLRRQRGDEMVSLLSHVLDAAETADFMDELSRDLTRLAAALGEQRYELLAQVPAEGSFAQRLGDWLQSLPRPIAIAERPNVR